MTAADPTRPAPAPPPDVGAADRPRLARHVRLSFCRTRQRHILQLPETVVVLRGSGGPVLELCDGRRTVAGIVAALGARYQRVSEAEVRGFLSRLVARRWVTLAGPEAAADAEEPDG